MNELIDVFLKNPFFIILIIGGIFSLLKGKGQEEEQEKQKQEQAQQRQTRQRQQTRTVPNRAPQQQRSSYQEQAEKKEKPKANDNLSADEQWQQQMQQFANRLEDNDYSDNLHSGLTETSGIADEKRQTEVQDLVSKYNHKKFKKQFKGSLTSKGLVNSVVMAEVLGAPRATNPYQSIIDKRIGKKI